MFGLRLTLDTWLETSSRAALRQKLFQRRVSRGSQPIFTGQMALSIDFWQLGQLWCHAKYNDSYVRTVNLRTNYHNKISQVIIVLYQNHISLISEILVVNVSFFFTAAGLRNCEQFCVLTFLSDNEEFSRFAQLTH